MDVGPFLVADTQATKLIQPRKRPLDNLAPPAQAAAVLGAAHREQGQNVARAQTVPDGRRVIAAVAEHADRPPARSAAFGLQGWNGIDQRQGFL
jgi:hypothetical protein